MLRIAAFSVSFMPFAAAATSIAVAQSKSSAAQDDPQQLSLEVTALQALSHLDLSAAQLQELLRLAKGAASAPKSSGKTKVNAAFVKTLKALRTALLDDDGDRIDELKAMLIEIMDKDRVQIEDRVAISETARRQASQVIRLLKPSQARAYLDILDDDDIDLADLLEATLEKGKNADAAAWRTMRDQATADAAWLLAGSDDGRTRLATKLVTAILDQHHGAKPGKNAAPDLEKQVQQLIGTLDPFLMLRNAMEREMAELLSNPRLPLAIQHTLEQRRKMAAK